MGRTGGHLDAQTEAGEDEKWRMGVATTHQNRNVLRRAPRGAIAEPRKVVGYPSKLPEAETALICPRCGIQGRHRTWQACAWALLAFRSTRL